MLVLNAPQNLFFLPFGCQSALKSRRIEFFGPFLVPSRIFRGPQNHLKSPKWRQIYIKNLITRSPFGRPGTDSLPRSLLERSWAPRWSIWDDFLWILVSFFNAFPNIFAIRFAECNHFSIYFGHIVQWIFNISSRLFPRLARLIAKLANKNGLRKC